MQDFVKNLRQTNLYERIILASSFFMAAGFILFGVEFAKIGLRIPLPAFLGQLPTLNNNVFVFEIYLFFLTIVNTVFKKWRWPTLAEWKNNKLALITVFLFIFTIFRLFFDLKPNPILAVRNAAFGWYLYLPLLLFCSKLKAPIIEVFFKAVLIFDFALFLLSIVIVMAGRSDFIEWGVLTGVIYATLIFGLTVKDTSRAKSLLVALGLFIGFAYLQGFPRTTIAGLFGVILFLFITRRKRAVEMAIRLSVVAVIAIVSLFIGKATQPTPEVDPNWKGEVQFGIEGFRKHMWLDAFQLFSDNPVSGIGFQKQVVTRVYRGAGTFYPNDGIRHWHHPPVPIPVVSGPHNSYLNALARLGIVGILFLVLHLGSFLELLKKRYWASCIILYAGMIYAAANVGLEGPTRSFLLLLAVGAALKTASNKVNY